MAELVLLFKIHFFKWYTRRTINVYSPHSSFDKIHNHETTNFSTCKSFFVSFLVFFK